ncbi:Hypothetical predicted protein, partial [Olea europaea subsp. europaea]
SLALGSVNISYLQSSKDKKSQQIATHSPVRGDAAVSRCASIFYHCAFNSRVIIRARGRQGQEETVGSEEKDKEDSLRNGQR